VFCDFEIPLWFVKQRNIPSFDCQLNPDKACPTLEEKTKPVQDPVPRVKLKSPKNQAQNISALIPMIIEEEEKVLYQMSD
jgi:hypothetical protein